MQPAAQLITVYHFPTTLMASRLLRLLLLLATLLNFSFGRDFNVTRSRKAIEIGIGIGIGIGTGSGCSNGDITRECFQNDRLYNAYLVIQRFKSTITCDPQGITDTWSGTDICGKNSYVGFYCTTPPGLVNTPTVASVDFNGYRLAAPTVCGFVDQLTDLALFHANSNNFSGTVPNLRGLQYIYELDLSNNKLTGNFPADVLSLNNATFLDIRFNGYVGPVPAQVFKLSMLQVLFLNNNNFTGQLPAELGFTPAQYLTLANNKFTGPIPSSIVHAANTLLEVLFLNNQLSGCLPFEIGLLKKATVFDAGTNLLTGPIPLSFGCLKKIEQLNLADNKLYGEVPDVLCRLGIPGAGNLMNLSLSDNYFTSLGHSCWILLKKGVLDVRKNCIPGVLDQRSPEECKWFLWQKKYCPLNTYIPCQSPWPEGADQLNSKGAAAAAAEAMPVADGARDRSRASGYTTYSALHQNPKP
ncbi:uncharacterized protein At4g06744-like [Ananas comosus]|uniref:Uncharacterized protein At4g06744-like n=1 Tax=Ananas comosus TaxID=4615 RepID=A0A6P5GZC9_ANACO|nr:uncharacterized protein At4g06744-like [Ananas comosus]